MTEVTYMDSSAHTTKTDEIRAKAWQWDEIDSDPSATNRLVSLITSVPRLDTTRFLNGAYGQERIYWSEPSGSDSDGLTIAGFGVAAMLSVQPVLDEDISTTPAGYRFDEIERQAKALFERAIILEVDQNTSRYDSKLSDGRPANDHPARPRLFGGFAFQDDFIPDNTWSMFCPAQFVLPHYQVVHTNGRTYMTINTLVDGNESLHESLAGIREALIDRVVAVLGGQARPIGDTHLRYPMSPEAWSAIIDRATQAIHDGLLEKVVLSRVCEVRSNELIDGAATLDYLNDSYGDCFRFLFEPYPQHTFFGATPELLVRKEGEQVTTMALAGSIARGRTVDEDESLAQQLLDSAKNRHEHQLVAQAILASLEGAVDDLITAADPVVLPLRNIQHLLTPIHGRIVTGEAGLLPLVRRLHPTPAMGGVPTDEAMTFLRRSEPVPRGWYAAPIGWIDAHGDGVFAVAIRSAVIQHDRAWLYAGAGIVADSQPEHEWTETALKFRPMLGALGVEENV